MPEDDRIEKGQAGLETCIKPGQLGARIRGLRR
jgi:hypothetical protein